MNLFVYKMECLTNLHVGSGDFNYGVVDNEVERDCLSGNPVIHASGVKGALRDMAESQKKDVKYIFGDIGDNKESKKGAYKFFDAQLLSRPLRVNGSESISYISVTTPEIINNFIDTLNDFGVANTLNKINVDSSNTKKVYSVDFSNTKKFYSNIKDIYIESDEAAYKTVEIPAGVKETLDAILGGNYALVKSFDDYKLPVIARNKLGENKNLWYEEFVPHHSVFYMMIMCEDAVVDLDFSKPVQFGGNSSIGYGYTKINAFEVK